MEHLRTQSRREFMASVCAAGSATFSLSATAQRSVGDTIQTAAFIKPLQSLSYDDLCGRLVEIGFDGLEVTVRPGGYILPQNAADELPELAQVAKKHDIGIAMLTTNITDVDSAHAESILRTARALGVRQYRMGYYRYDLGKSVADQLEAWRPAFRDLAAMNRDLGVQALYQNHSGDRNFGAAIWDTDRMLQGIDPAEIAILFDIYHATVEGGLSWPIQWNLAQDRLGGIYVKDFRWNGDDVEPVPLGEGRISRRFFADVRRMNYDGIVSVHVEYQKSAPVKLILENFAHDLRKLKEFI